MVILSNSDLVSSTGLVTQVFVSVTPALRHLVSLLGPISPVAATTERPQELKFGDDLQQLSGVMAASSS